MTQSIFCNFNQTLGNQKACSYKSFYSDTIELPPNSTIALYQASLEKKPISLKEDSKLSLDLTDSQAKIFHSPNDTPLTGTYNNTLIKYEISIPRGSYSKAEFLKKVVSLFNTKIDDVNTNSTTNPVLGYKFTYENNTDNVFLGLTPNYPIQKIIPMDITAGDENVRNKNMLIVSAGAGSEIGAITVDNITGAASNVITNYVVAQSAINPLSQTNDYNYNDNDRVPTNILTFNIIDNSTDGSYQGVCFTNSAQMESNGVLASGELEKDTLFFPTAGIVSVPKCLFGLELRKEAQNKLLIYQSVLLSSNTAGEAIGDMEIVQIVNVGETGINNKFVFQLYYDDDFQKIDSGEKNYYYRVLMNLVNTQSDDLFNPEQKVIYDSRFDNKKISKDIIEACFQYSNAGLNDYYAFGAVPVFYGYNYSTTVADDYGFMSVKGNFINIVNNTVRRRDHLGLISVPIKTSNHDLEDIIGNVSIFTDPNGYPKQKTPESGITELYGNSTNYNIEIENLPVKSYTNTNTNQDIGTERPVVFQVNNLFSGPVNDINSGKIMRNVYSKQIKKLSLNNQLPIRINTLDVKIKRSYDNSEADELTDSQIELLLN